MFLPQLDSWPLQSATKRLDIPRFLYWHSSKRWHVGFDLSSKKCTAWRSQLEVSLFCTGWDVPQLLWHFHFLKARSIPDIGDLAPPIEPYPQVWKAASLLGILLDLVAIMHFCLRWKRVWLWLYRKCSQLEVMEKHRDKADGVKKVISLVGFPFKRDHVSLILVMSLSPKDKVKCFSMRDWNWAFVAAVTQPCEAECELWAARRSWMLNLLICLIVARWMWHCFTVGHVVIQNGSSGHHSALGVCDKEQAGNGWNISEPTDSRSCVQHCRQGGDSERDYWVPCTGFIGSAQHLVRWWLRNGRQIRIRLNDSNT